MRHLPSPPGARLAALLVVALVSTLFLYRADELPLPHGDERSFLDVPYRFATFGDVRYPVFISESFGAASLRPYPPITALALRSAVLRVVGFSARNSRYFSAALILVVLIAAGRWMQARFMVTWPLAALMLAPAAMTPVVLLAARSTRLEQETFFFGALSALLLASGGERGLASSPGRLMLGGAFAAISAGMHPFGVVYGGLAALVLVAARSPRAFVSWLAGAAVGAAPTAWWMASMGRDFLAFTAAVSVKYQAREEDLVGWLSTFASVSWLKPLGLPDRLVARLASVQHSAFSDYVGFPFEPGAFSLLLRFLFWAQVFFVVRFFVRHLRSRRPENDGVAWLCLLAAGFLVFTVSYVPNTTYGLYGAFHVQLAFAAVCLVETEGRAVWKTPRFALVTAAFVAFGLASAQRLVAAPAVLTLDRELEAIADVGRAAGIRPEDTVMTSTETWIAAGERNTSLFELIHYGRGGSPLDAIVYRRSYVEFYLNAGLPQDPESRAKILAARRAVLSRALAGLQLAGLLILDEAHQDAIYFFRRDHRDALAVASLDPSRIVPLRIVGSGRTARPEPRVECDTEALPTCAFHER